MVVDGVQWHADNTFLGMRSEMELDSSFVYWIHCIYRQIDGTTFYLRVTPDTTQKAQLQRIQIGTSAYMGYSAIFHGSSVGVIGDTNPIATGYQAYIVGSIQDYLVYPSGAMKDFSEQSAGIWVTLENDDFCTS